MVRVESALDSFESRVSSNQSSQCAFESENEDLNDSKLRTVRDTSATETAHYPIGQQDPTSERSVLQVEACFYASFEGSALDPDAHLQRARFLLLIDSIGL